jgi:hypothetical protein
MNLKQKYFWQEFTLLVSLLHTATGPFVWHKHTPAFPRDRLTTSWNAVTQTIVRPRPSRASRVSSFHPCHAATRMLIQLTRLGWPHRGSTHSVNSLAMATRYHQSHWNGYSDKPRSYDSEKEADDRRSLCFTECHIQCVNEPTKVLFKIQLCLWKIHGAWNPM